MANKRLSELNELLAADIQPDDLTLVTDSSVLESKKLRLQSIRNWVLINPTLITGSLCDTAYTASYITSRLQSSGLLPPPPPGFVAAGANGVADYAISASYALSASWAPGTNTSLYSLYSVSSSFASSSVTASYISYSNRDNGRVHTASYALTSSYVDNAKSSSYIWYTGDPNGTASYALGCLSASYASVLNVDTASYLLYNGSRPNGTASYAFIAQDGTSSFLKYVGFPNGTASYSISSITAITSSYTTTASYLRFEGPFNGTASYAVKTYLADTADSASIADVSLYSYTSSVSVSSSYASTASLLEGTASYSLTSSYLTGTASYAILAGTVTDTDIYRMWGPFSTLDSGGTNTTTAQRITNFVISPPTTVGTTVIIVALCDIKSPMTNTDTDSQQVILYLDDLTPGGTHSYQLDATKPSNYIGITTAVSGAVSLTGYIRSAATLAGTLNSVSGSWYRFSLVASGGATIDTTRGTKFFVYTKTNTTVTKTSYPPF